MRKRLDEYEENMGNLLQKAYAEGRALVYPYLGNGWMQIFKDRQIKDKLLRAIEKAKNEKRGGA